MSIRRSIAAAVFVAAVSAPTALGAAPALADTAPTPTGQSQPDVPATDAPTPEAPAAEAPAAETPAPEAPATETPAPETPAPETPAPETPATDPGTGRPAPGGTAPAPGGSSSQELDDLRVRLLRVMAEPGHSRYFQERASTALDGTAEDIRHFLDVEMPRIIRDDKRIQVLRIIDTTGQGTPIWQAGQKALDGDDAAIDHFLEVEWPELVAKERRGKVLHEMIRPGSTLTLKEAAARVLDADELKAFLADLDTIDETSARIMIAQAMSMGGPEVREAANRVLDSHDPAYLRSFLLTDLGEAQARDTANAKANDANWRKVLQTLIRPGSSLTLDEAAGQALGVDGAKAFLAGLDG
ncbi:ALF repeat-containing protein, partial [Kitasatospora griseola]|uniref:ALF repeat-containing protein n=1 Tax=Kitasatospora griseola TaxID=2064 RepID=UPI0016700ADE